MRTQITTTIEKTLLKKARHEAVESESNLNEVLERALKDYFNQKEEVNNEKGQNK